MEETKEYHIRYLRAINNPLRRKILRTLKDGKADIRDLALAMKLDEKALSWHMDVLVHGFCVEKEEKDGVTVYTITDEGKVVDFVDK
jgi:DNA-binding transcriptional ArsR family regulator